tara:strand:+ start:22 stop:1167 length:1146 start_codon:yes stop_codon:yes gene_type:complete
MSNRWTGGFIQAYFDPLAPSELQGYSAFAWGPNSSGQLGSGNTVYRSSPVQVSGDPDWTEVNQAAFNAVGIVGNGTIWSWGAASRGRSGQNNVIVNSSPVQIGTLTNWSTADVAGSVALAIKTDGTLWSWGYNVYGELGINNRVETSSPIQVGGLNTWLKVTSAYNDAAAIKTDGTLWTWGRGSNGQLGHNDIVNRSSPVQVGTLTNWSSHAAGSGGSVAAIKTDGTLWSWGWNGLGGLGHNNLIDRSSPVQVGALTNWSNAAMAQNGNLIAVKTDGTLWVCGQNNYGQLGLNNTVLRSSPVQVGALTTWLKGAASYGIAGAVKTDGTIWTWGQNTAGKLGQGDVINKSSPVQVGAETGWLTINAGQASSTNSGGFAALKG